MKYILVIIFNQLELRVVLETAVGLNLKVLGRIIPTKEEILENYSARSAELIILVKQKHPLN